MTNQWLVSSLTCSYLTYLRTVFSLRPGSDMAQLLLPYITLSFDWNIIANNAVKTALIGDFTTLKHLSQYGQLM